MSLDSRSLWHKHMHPFELNLYWTRTIPLRPTQARQHFSSLIWTPGSYVIESLFSFRVWNVSNSEPHKGKPSQRHSLRKMWTRTTNYTALSQYTVHTTAHKQAEERLRWLRSSSVSVWAPQTAAPAFACLKSSCSLYSEPKDKLNRRSWSLRLDGPPSWHLDRLRHDYPHSPKYPCNSPRNKQQPTNTLCTPGHNQTCLIS